MSHISCLALVHMIFSVCVSLGMFVPLLLTELVFSAFPGKTRYGPCFIIVVVVLCFLTKS